MDTPIAYFGGCYWRLQRHRETCGSSGHVSGCQLPISEMGLYFRQRVMLSSSRNKNDSIVSVVLCNKGWDRHRQIIASIEAVWKLWSNGSLNIDFTSLHSTNTDSKADIVPEILTDGTFILELPEIWARL